MATERSGSACGYFGWCLLGATLGGLAGLLLTPRTREDNRSYMSDRAGEWLDKSRELFEEQTQRLMGAFEAGREAMREEMRKTPPTLG